MQVNAKLLENVVHKLGFEFCSIVWQYEVRAHVDRQVIINENVNNGVSFLVTDGKSLWQSN